MGTKEIAVPFSKWLGINIRDDPSFIREGDAGSELADCVNFDIKPGGTLAKRKGFKTLHDGSTLGANKSKVIGKFITSSLSRLIAVTATKVFYSTDGVAWTEILYAAASIPNVEWGVQYGNKFYLIRRGSTVIEYDGAATTALAGSPDGTVAAWFKDRLFVCDAQDATTGSRVFFSDIATPSSWPGTNFIDVNPGDGESVVAFAIIQDVLLIFKWTRVYGLYIQGAPADWTLRLINPTIGCVSKFTVKEIEGYIYFVGPRGVYKTDGASIQELSEPIEPLFRTRIMDLSTIDLDSAAWWEDKYILLINVYTPTSQTWSGFSAGQTWASKLAAFWGSTAPVQLYAVYHVRVGGWTAYDPVAGISPATFIEIQTATPLRGLYCGSYTADGKIYRLEDGQYQDDTTNFECLFVTRTYDFDQGDEVKRGKWSSLEFLGDGAATFTYLENAGSGDAIAITGDGFKKTHKLVGPGYFRNLAFKFQATHANYIEIFMVILHLHLKRTLITSPV